MFTSWQYCLPADNIVYLPTILLTCWQYCSPADNIVYLLAILFTSWQYCLPADNIVYLLTILFTCWQYCLPADNNVYLLTIIFTCWQERWADSSMSNWCCRVSWSSYSFLQEIHLCTVFYKKYIYVQFLTRNTFMYSFLQEIHLYTVFNKKYIYIQLSSTLYKIHCRLYFHNYVQWSPENCIMGRRHLHKTEVHLMLLQIK